MKTKILLFLLCLVSTTFVANSEERSRTIAGRITDAKIGEAIIGASISVKGTTIGTITNLEGYYALNIPVGEQILIISSMGYATQEINITNNTDTLNVALEEDISLIEEVIVIGIDIMPKRQNLNDDINVIKISK